MKNKLTSHVKTKLGKWQVIHSPKRNFIWYKNAKTAGTSMYRGIMIKEIDDLITYKEQPEEFDLWWDDLTDEKINDCFTFTFVRNPFDRLVSAFNHIVMEDLLLDEPLETGETVLPKATAYLLFHLFVKRGLKFHNLNDYSTHWMPQYFFAECDEEIMVDFVGKYENLYADWKFVANKLQISKDLPFTPASNTAKLLGGRREVMQGSHFSEYYFNDVVLEMVYDFYKRDMDLFGYSVSDPVGISLRPHPWHPRKHNV